VGLKKYRRLERKADKPGAAGAAWRLAATVNDNYKLRWNSMPRDQFGKATMHR
jgi:hypothetical protein